MEILTVSKYTDIKDNGRNESLPAPEVTTRNESLPAPGVTTLGPRRDKLAATAATFAKGLAATATAFSKGPPAHSQWAPSATADMGLYPAALGKNDGLSPEKLVQGLDIWLDNQTDHRIPWQPEQGRVAGLRWYLGQGAEEDLKDFIAALGLYGGKGTRAGGELVHALMKSLGHFYGSSQGEYVDPGFKRRVLGTLMAYLASDCKSVEQGHAMVIEGVIEAVRNGASADAVLDHVAGRIRDCAKLPQRYANWLSRVLIRLEYPSLLRQDLPADCAPGSLAHTSLMLGTALVQAAGKDPDSYSVNELMRLATLQDIALAKGVQKGAGSRLPPRYGDVARIFAAANDATRCATPREAIDILLKARGATLTRSLTRSRKIAEILRKRSTPMPLRRKIAQKLLVEHGLDPNQMVIASGHFKAIPWIGTYKEEKTALDAYLNGDDITDYNGRAASLPDLTSHFNQEYDRFKAAQLDGLTKALNLVLNDDMAKADGDIEIIQPVVTHTVRDRGPFGALYKRELRVASPSARIVSFKVKGRPHRYLVTLHNAKRILAERLDDDVTLDAFTQDRYDEIFYFRNGEVPLSGELDLQIYEVAKSEHKMRWSAERSVVVKSDTVGRTIAEAIEAKPLERQRKLAYEPTQEERTQEVVRSVILSLIPLYSAIKAFEEDRPLDAAFLLVWDALLMVPVLGELAVAGRAVTESMVEVVTAARAAAEAAGGLTTIEGLGAGARTLAQTGADALAAELPSAGKRVATALGMAMDPGILLAYDLVNGGAELLTEGISAIRRMLGDVGDAASELEKLEKLDAEQMSKIVREDGQNWLQVGTDRYEIVPVDSKYGVAVQPATGRQGDYYFAVNPATGLPFGPRLYKDTEGFMRVVEEAEEGARLSGITLDPDLEKVVEHYSRPELPQTAPDESGIVMTGVDEGILVSGDKAWFVRDDKSKGTWRIFDPQNRAKPGTPIEFDAHTRAWKFNRDIGLRGGDKLQTLEQSLKEWEYKQGEEAGQWTLQRLDAKTPKPQGNESVAFYLMKVKCAEPGELGRNIVINGTVIREIPPGLEQFEHLTDLRITDSIIEHAVIPSLPELKNLDLSDNFLVSLDLGDLTKLTDLNLGKNWLTEFPQGLDKLKELSSVNLAGNRIRNPRPGIDVLPDGVYIDLSENPLTEEARKYISEALGISPHHLTGRIQRPKKSLDDEIFPVLQEHFQTVRNQTSQTWSDRAFLRVLDALARNQAVDDASIIKKEEAITRLNLIYGEDFLDHVTRLDIDEELETYKKTKAAERASFEDWFAIRDYKEEGYARINALLRQGSTDPAAAAAAQKQVAALRDALMRQSLVEHLLGEFVPRTLYRGELRDASVVNGWSEGDVLELSGFTSTSEDEEVAEQFIAEDPPEGKVNVMYQMERTSVFAGPNISNVLRDTEEEVVLLPGTRVKVTDIEHMPDRVVINLELETIAPEYEQMQRKERFDTSAASGSGPRALRPQKRGASSQGPIVEPPSARVRLAR
jgi:hypothetical protein